jgi:hypothetical protein
LGLPSKRLTHDMHKLCRACEGFAAGTEFQVQRSCRYALLGLWPFFCLVPLSKMFALAILPLAVVFIWRGNLCALGIASHTTWPAGMRAELQDGVELA